MVFNNEFCKNVGKKITYKERDYTHPISGVMVSCSKNLVIIKIILDDNPVDGSLEKYGEVLYKQIQKRYDSDSQIKDAVFEDLTEPQSRTEEDFFKQILKQFLNQRVSFTTTDNKTITDVIQRVAYDGIYIEDNSEIHISKFFPYNKIMTLPTLAPPEAPVTAVATEIPTADAEFVKNPTVPIVEANIVEQNKKKVYLICCF